MMVAIGPSISRPGSPVPSASGSRPSAVDQRGHQNGRQPLGRAAQRGFQPPRHAFHVHQVLVVRHQHDGVAQGDAEQRDEPHQRAQRQPTAGREQHRADAADQRETVQVAKGDRQVAQVPERDIQQEKDPDAGDDRMHDELFARLRLGWFPVPA